MNKQIYLPEHIFKNILDYCGDTPKKKHNRRMNVLIKDINLFIDLYSIILQEVIYTEAITIEQYYKFRIDYPQNLMNMIEDGGGFNCEIINGQEYICGGTIPLNINFVNMDIITNHNVLICKYVETF
tara:strand:+ start:45 stop:425 length:381 start_codon:yes stop_codon:yes gene_type:complete